MIPTTSNFHLLLADAIMLVKTLVDLLVHHKDSFP